MSEIPLRRRQGIVPYVYVDDVRGYLDFLARAFGFATVVYHVDPGDPQHVHAEAALGDALIMIGQARRKWGTASARRLPAVHGGLYVVVDDADAHARRARAAGATIDSEPEDKPWGDRMYAARDCEEQRWYFAAPLVPAVASVAPVAEPDGSVPQPDASLAEPDASNPE